jgi:superfamily II DNA or RNA helicase
MSYEAFVAGKLAPNVPTGIADAVVDSPHAFAFQQALVTWALRRGRAAIFAATGLGKTRMQLLWAYAVAVFTGKPVLILAPLAVAQQTVAESSALGLRCAYVKSGLDVLHAPHTINIFVTNYDRLHLFEPSVFGGVVLDESSIIKHYNGKTLQALMEAFSATPFRLCCTATPSPNDYTELGTHAEFLGICSRAEMLSEFFVHDGGETQVWRLEGHARQQFWRYVASWAALVRSPADLGYDASAYELPPLHVEHHIIAADEESVRDRGLLCAVPASTLMERRQARKESIGFRVTACADMIAEALGVRRDEEELLDKKVRERSGVPGQEARGLQGAGGSGPGETGGLHEGIPPQESGQVEADTGDARAAERGPAEALCGRPGVSGGAQDAGQGLEQVQPAEEEAPETARCVRNRAVGLRRADGFAERDVRDLRALGHEQTEVLPCSRPLPQDGPGPRDSLRELQPRAGQVQGRRRQALRSDFLPDQKWIAWCDYNAEQDDLEKALTARGIPCVSIQGSTPPDDRIAMEASWRLGAIPVLITKASLFGFGLNWQHCANMAFVGVTDSWEAYFQAVRRIWRFGQKHECHVHIFASEAESAVLDNLKRKERDANAMAEELSRETSAMVREEVRGTVRETNEYAPALAMRVPDWCAGEQSQHARAGGLSADLVSLILKDKSEGFSNREIARRHGVSPSTVSDYCSGKRRPA